MKSEAQLQGLLNQLKAIQFLQTPTVGFSWEQIELIIKGKIDLLEWILGLRKWLIELWA